MNAVYAEFFDEDTAPARSTVQVAGLPLNADDEVMASMELIMYVISGSTHQRLGASLIEEMDAEFAGVVNRHFPDGERYIRVLMDVNGQDVVVVQNTFPDKRIMKLYQSYKQ